MNGFQQEILESLIRLFWTDSIYEKELMDAINLAVNALHKAEMGYNGKFGHTLGRIQHIAIMSRIEMCYTFCILGNQTVVPTLHGFQAIKYCIQCMDLVTLINLSFILLIIMMA